MKPDLLLINPPFLSLTSLRGVGHQVPLGLLMVGGALLDAGFSVQLLDAEADHLSLEEILAHVRRLRPRYLLTGHAGSTPAHLTCAAMLRAIRRAHPSIITIYGGPFPTYHAAEILRDQPAIDFIVRGEGEATAVALLRALDAGDSLQNVASIAFRDDHARVLLTPQRAPLALDQFRIGWELLDENHSWDRYQCFGLGRAVIIQFSRGCPHHCTYCGQREFWVQWRHRDPVALVDEIEWLIKNRRVRFITLADENPTTLRAPWQRFLEELASRQLPVKLFATIRATDIARDAGILHLYHAAGIQYVLMGIETTDAPTLKAIKKGSTTRVDLQACNLLRQHHIFSIIGHIVGLGNETWPDFLRAFQQLAHYDGDYLNAMYVTPHAWTAFALFSQDRLVVDGNLAHWDYRHQVLAQRSMKPWQLFTAVKLLELAFHLRPRRLWRLLTQSDFSRQQFFWNLTHTASVWFTEILSFLREPRTPAGILKHHFQTPLGEPQNTQPITLRIPPRPRLSPPASLAATPVKNPL